ncbi:MAG TPA: hypothetical protein VFJ13_05490 [Paracoccaceae bacterium]|nr:hypothetical protein [Paracoccaceae bacterium]
MKKTFLASAAAIGLMGGAAFAQSIVLVPEGEGSADARFILVPVPQADAATGATGQDRAEAMALEFYNRGYQRGMADAQSRVAAEIDPAAIQQIGRELFERGYMLGVMQAHAQMTATEMPEFDQKQVAAADMADEAQSADAAGDSDEAATADTGDAADAAGQATQQETVLADEESPEAEPVAAESEQVVLGSRDTEEYGVFIADDTGRPVYMFTTDEQGMGEEDVAQSSCYDACAEAWPPVTSPVKPLAEDMANETLISAFEREDGSNQVTYNGWPLYYFVKDQGSEMPTGQDVQGFGGEWYLLQPNGELVGHE